MFGEDAVVEGLVDGGAAITQVSDTFDALHHVCNYILQAHECTYTNILICLSLRIEGSFKVHTELHFPKGAPRCEFEAPKLVTLSAGRRLGRGDSVFQCKRSGAPAAGLF